MTRSFEQQWQSFTQNYLETKPQAQGPWDRKELIIIV